MCDIWDILEHLSLRCHLRGTHVGLLYFMKQIAAFVTSTNSMPDLQAMDDQRSHKAYKYGILTNEDFRSVGDATDEDHTTEPASSRQRSGLLTCTRTTGLLAALVVFALGTTFTTALFGYQLQLSLHSIEAGHTGREFGECGAERTVESARAHGCIFDAIAWYWIRPECSQPELYSRYVERVDWRFYNDTSLAAEFELPLNVSLLSSPYDNLMCFCWNPRRFQREHGHMLIAPTYDRKSYKETIPLCILHDCITRSIANTARRSFRLRFRITYLWTALCRHGKAICTTARS